jgi:hypothetical protein
LMFKCNFGSAVHQWLFHNPPALAISLLHQCYSILNGNRDILGIWVKLNLINTILA